LKVSGELVPESGGGGEFDRAGDEQDVLDGADGASEERRGTAVAVEHRGAVLLEDSAVELLGPEDRDEGVQGDHAEEQLEESAQGIEEGFTLDRHFFPLLAR